MLTLGDPHRFQRSRDAGAYLGLRPKQRQSGERDPQLAALADQNDEEFFHPLSARERAALIATMKKLVQAHGLQTLPTE